MLVRNVSYKHGQGMQEYALIIALVAVMVIAALVLLGAAWGAFGRDTRCDRCAGAFFRLEVAGLPTTSR